jgi:hypothetical protein
MLKSFLSGLTIGGMGAIVAMQYHLVRTNERVLIVPRIHQPPLRSAYVDVRHWSTAMWEHYPELTEAVTKSGHMDLINSADGSKPAATIYESSHQTLLHPVPPPREAQLPTQLAQGDSAAKQEILVPVPHPLEASQNLISTIPAKPSAAVKISEAALPELQMPVPCPVEKEIAPLKKPEATPTAPKSQTGWMSHLLKAIVPQTEKVSEPAKIIPEPESLELIPEQSPPKAAPVQRQTEFPVSPRRIGGIEVKPL